ncbi:AAA family ATPase [Pseudonocardia sp. HH130630-07]|uniref:AAA family ATPase n=1 Tax=Pseudonocardia sp. HH130630-07 TaxID=1690815 RepID=UPI000814C834|nr:AAA family ATPase [Pseudonocardia sp. HH130630-07]ANY07551.1 hypothetical protein AFB00_16020 [Pseudonocardia sp. HH130630-07]
MLPVVWVLGTSGVGKSTAGYRMLSELAARGVTAAFVDADQLRLARGVAASETELIASSMPALSDGYRAQGARVLVVAGLADDRDHLSRLLPGVPRERVLAVWLEADDDAVRERIRRRGWLVHLADDAVAHAARIDPAVADLRLDTTGLTPAEVAARITGPALAHLEIASGHHGTRPVHGATAVPRRVVLVTGPGGAGVSTIGYQVVARLARAGEPVGYLDAHQLRFLGTSVGDDRLAGLRARNVRAVAGGLVRGGARTVVVGGDVPTVRRLGVVRGAEQVRLFWLHASPDALAERVTSRAGGGGPPVAGDRRLGLTGRALADAIAAAVRESGCARPSGAEVVDTTGRDPAQVAEAIVASLSAQPR